MDPVRSRLRTHTQGGETGVDKTRTTVHIEAKNTGTNLDFESFEKESARMRYVRILG